VSTALAIASLELDPVLEKILTPSLAIALMLQFKVVHPPAAACSIIFSSAIKDKFKNPLYLFFPTLLGCTWMLLVQYLVARSVHSSKSAGPASGPAASRTDKVESVTIAPPAPAASGPDKPAFKVPAPRSPPGVPTEPNFRRAQRAAPARSPCLGGSPRRDGVARIPRGSPRGGGGRRGAAADGRRAQGLGSNVRSPNPELREVLDQRGGGVRSV